MYFQKKKNVRKSQHLTYTVSILQLSTRLCFLLDGTYERKPVKKCGDGSVRAVGAAGGPFHS